MNQAFLLQWQVYRRGAPFPALEGLEPRTESEFDAEVSVGEIRVFADTNRPLVALVVEDRRLSGWRIVPVSPFCAPASSRELMVGERVFQLWNATVVSRRFAARGWRVETLDAGTTEAVRGALAAARPGMLTAGDGVQAKYEREFLVGTGSLIPFARPAAAEAPRFAWWPRAMGLAASVAICLGAGYVLMRGEGPRLVRDWRAGYRAADIGLDSGVIELCSAGGSGEEPAAPDAEAAVEIAPPVADWARLESAPEVARTVRFADVKGPKIPEGITRMRLKGERFLSPVSAPMSVEFLASAAPRQAAVSAVAGYGAFAAPLASAPAMSCTLSDGRSDGLVADAELRIEGEGADGAKLTLMFDPAVIAGYRRTKNETTGAVDVRYELVAQPGRSISAAAVQVMLVWPADGGDRRTPLVPGRNP